VGQKTELLPFLGSVGLRNVKAGGHTSIVGNFDKMPAACQKNEAEGTFQVVCA
jgi:hypothetical protein